MPFTVRCARGKARTREGQLEPAVLRQILRCSGPVFKFAPAPHLSKFEEAPIRLIDRSNGLLSDITVEQWVVLVRPRLHVIADLLVREILRPCVGQVRADEDGNPVRDVRPEPPHFELVALRRGVVLPCIVERDIVQAFRMVREAVDNLVDSPRNPEIARHDPRCHTGVIALGNDKSLGSDDYTFR